MLIKYRYKQQAFTLIELIVTIVIIGVSITGTLLSFTTAARYASDPLIKQQAVTIAKSYLEEILQKNFPTTLPCPAAPTGGRAVYASICDYNNLINNGAIDQNGQAIAGLGSYNVSVILDTATASLGTLTAGTQVIRVDVTVTNVGLKENIILSGYRTNY